MRRRGATGPARPSRVATAACAAVVLLGCATGGGGRRPGGERGGALPPIPEVRGELRLRVEYPDSLERVAVRDSNFLFGSVGTGGARLTVDGVPVPVEPNGAFLAWLPGPKPERGDTAVYRIVAGRDGEADTLVHRVLLPPPPFRPAGRVWIDTTALSLPDVRWALPDERIEIALRAAPSLDVWLEAAGTRISLAENLRPGRYRAAIAASELRAAADSLPARGESLPAAADSLPPGGDSLAVAADSAPAAGDSLPLRFVVASERDTAVVERSLRLRILDPAALPVAELWEMPSRTHGASGLVVGRPVPYGSFHWPFPVGTRAEVAGRIGDRLRLRLGPGSAAWVDVEDALLLPGAAAPAAEVGSFRVEPLEDRLRVTLPLAAPVPLRVEEPEDRVLALVLYGARGATERIAYGPRDDLLEQVRWRQMSGDRWRLELRLREPVWGYRVRWTGDPGRPRLRLDVRRPPPIRREAPLAGRRIAIDPGHPPAGARGPTGYYEADANLAVARRLADALGREGAEPILVRRGPDTLGLYERRSRAREEGAELMVSIHNNALPDGVRPFGREGTSTYYYHSHSRELADAVQRGMLRSMGLRDLGIYWGNLALPRESWMPTVLTEGAFMMVPRHEAALRSEEFRARYAHGVLEGIREFLRGRARR